MIKTVELLSKLNEKDKEQYRDMLSQVNIPDFYKCIAQFSGLSITEVDDETMADYLITWAKNKYRFYKMLKNKLRADIEYTYTKPDEDMSDNYGELGKEYPAYYLWLQEFRHQRQNKIESTYRYDYHFDNIISKLFPGFSLMGSTVTHFFKSKLNAPDDLVTKIGRLYENDKITATLTISINPIDMMLASENPYSWQSCYRLELDRDDSHADGCMAAVLDSTSLITYVWNNEGKYDLYDNFKFKNIRYYRMRAWIAIAKDFDAIHFNEIYPGKSDYSEDLHKSYRDIIETYVANYMGVANKWRKNQTQEIFVEEYGYEVRRHPYSCYRENDQYGYSEYSDDSVYVNTELAKCLLPTRAKKEEDLPRHKIKVYDEKIKCACGCGKELQGSEFDEDEIEYDGEGFSCSHFYQREPDYLYCEYTDDECECGLTEWDDCECRDCPIYRKHNPVCSLNESVECHYSEYMTPEHRDEDDEWICKANCEECEGICFTWDRLKVEKQKEENNEEKEDKQEQKEKEQETATIKIDPEMTTQITWAGMDMAGHTFRVVDDMNYLHHIITTDTVNLAPGSTITGELPLSGE